MTKSEPTILWSQVVKFIGQFNHDLRNHLNAIELQSAFLGEIVENAEATSEIKHLREMTAEMSAQLQRLSTQIHKAPLRPMAYQAKEFLEDLGTKVRALHPEQSAGIMWQDSLGKETIEIDPHLLQDAFLELFANAFTHERSEGALLFAARPNGSTIEFTLREPKTKFDRPTEDWGARPLEKMRHGHYGLGLFRARAIFEAHHGTLQAKFDPADAALVSTITLPRSDK
ncbi:MAG: sensor histidine kinase [Chthoniobacterales bacterium]